MEIGTRVKVVKCDSFPEALLDVNGNEQFDRQKRLITQVTQKRTPMFGVITEIRNDCCANYVVKTDSGEELWSMRSNLTKVGV